jgi:hypothetical protein
MDMEDRLLERLAEAKVQKNNVMDEKLLAIRPW